jgi:hypothetical protein
MKESDFKNQLISIATMYGWRVHHDLPSMNAQGRYRTAIQGHAGFPDIVFVKANDRGVGGIIFAELKTQIGRLDIAQKEWLEEIRLAGGEWYVWRPSDLAAATDRLAGRRRRLTTSREPSI